VRRGGALARWLRPAALAALSGLLAAGCASALRPGDAKVHPLGDATPAGDPTTLAARVHALVRRIEREPSSTARADLAVEAVAAGLRCERAAPGSAACDYALGVALGVQARERPATLREGLTQMAVRLRRAAAAEPGLDRAGPHRVLALLLLRAPGWPLGPGDPEEGLVEARRAVALFPEYAPNQLALAEALLAGGDVAGGREAARQAASLAAAAEAAGEPEAAAWRREAEKLSRTP